MPVNLRLRLSAMMFVEFFIWGAWYVTAPSYLGRIGFAGEDIGWTYSAGPIAAMITPLFVGMVADRFFAVERVLGTLHLLGAGLMFGATQLMAGGASPATINWALVAYMLCYFPTIALANSLSMRNIDDSEKQFPGIRVFGTLGWIVAALMINQMGWGSSIEMFQLAAASSLFLGLYCFSLPHTPPAAATEGSNVRALLGLDAMALLKNPPFAIFMVCSFLICIPLAFYYQLAERALQAGGLTDTPVKMSFGQMSEVLFMLVMPLCFARLGVKWMLFVGMLAWVVRYALFAIGAPDQIAWMLIAGVVLHGICYDFFFVTGQIYTDKAAPEHIRSQAQGLLVLCTLGLGMFVGAQVGGRVEAAYTTEEALSLQAQAAEVHRAHDELAQSPSIDAALQQQLDELSAEEDRLHLAHLQAIDWRSIWVFPAVGAGIIMLLFSMLFRERRDDQP